MFGKLICDVMLNYAEIIILDFELFTGKKMNFRPGTISLSHRICHPCLNSLII